ncbi:DUF2815 family protein [Culicoidibacter larvae]|nr:DUF2815 family protein [Culicoidibacter larvae]
MSSIILQNVRLSYANIWKPKGIDGGEPRYSASLLMDKDVNAKDIAKLNKAIKECYDAAVPTIWGGKAPAASKFNSPLYDGDDEADDKGEAYVNTMFINPKSKNQPGIVDKKVQPILDQTEVYSGCYANVSVSIYAYNHPQGGKGIAFGLNNIQKVKDGEPLGGVAPKAEDEFSAVDDSDDLLD